MAPRRLTSISPASHARPVDWTRRVAYRANVRPIAQRGNSMVESGCREFPGQPGPPLRSAAASPVRHRRSGGDSALRAAGATAHRQRRRQHPSGIQPARNTRPSDEHADRQAQAAGRVTGFARAGDTSRREDHESRTRFCRSLRTMLGGIVRVAHHADGRSVCSASPERTSECGGLHSTMAFGTWEIRSPTSGIAPPTQTRGECRDGCGSRPAPSGGYGLGGAPARSKEVR
jgi:hypothetical protein